MNRAATQVVAALAAAAIVVLVLINCGTTGTVFPKSVDISDFEVVQVLGIDRTPSGELELTLVGDRSGDEGKHMAEISSFTGKTVMQALGKMSEYSDKRHHLGYVDFLLIGERAARHDITQCLDYLLTDYEFRYSANVAIVRGGTASELLYKTSTADRRITALLTNLERPAAELGTTHMMRVIDLVQELEIPNAAAVVPAVRLVDKARSTVVGGELPEKNFIPDGFAVICDFRLKGYYDASSARAYNYITDRARTAPLEIADSDGNAVGLEIQHEKIKLITHWDGDTLKGVTYDIRLTANLTEQHARRRLTCAAQIDLLKDAAAEKLRREFLRVLERAQSLGEDSLGLGERIRLRHPVRWGKYVAPQWGTLFSTLDLDVNVTCEIMRTYDLREPIGSIDTDAQTHRNGRLQ